MISWGWNVGQLALDQKDLTKEQIEAIESVRGLNVTTPKRSPFFDNIKIASIAAGGSHTVLSTKEGKLYSFGVNQSGQLGHSGTETVYDPKEVEYEEIDSHGKPKGAKFYSILAPIRHLKKDERVQELAAGDRHSLALTDMNRIFAWGQNYNGQLGLGHTASQNTPTLVDIFNDRIIQISAGSRHTIALTEKGKALAFGYGLYGQLGLGDCLDQSYPQFVKALDSEHIVQVMAKINRTYFLTKSNNIYACGGPGVDFKSKLYNSIPRLVYSNSWLPIRHPPNVDRICCSSKYLVVLNTKGQIFLVAERTKSDEVIGKLLKLNITQQTSIESLSCTLNFTSEMINSQEKGDEQKVVTPNQLKDKYPDIYHITIDFKKFANKKYSDAKRVVHVVGGENFFVCQADNGQLFSWGQNSYGELGQGDKVDSYKICDITKGDIDSVRFLACGCWHVTAVLGRAQWKLRTREESLKLKQQKNN